MCLFKSLLIAISLVSWFVDVSWKLLLLSLLVVKLFSMASGCWLLLLFELREFHVAHFGNFGIQMKVGKCY